MGGRKKMFGPGGVPQRYKPHSEATKRKISEGQRLALKRRAGRISAQANPGGVKPGLIQRRYRPRAY
jgi:hypothetical protein